MQMLDPRKKNWHQMPETMLAKCTEAACFRKGWPVIVPTGALPETCKYGTHLFGEFTLEKFAVLVIDTMTGPSIRRYLASTNGAAISSHCW